MRRRASDSEIDDEAVGFHAQQAIEKWLKAVLALRDSKVERIHDLGRLLELIGKANVDPPPGATRLDELTIYAVPMRYADLLDAEPLDRVSVGDWVDGVGKWAAEQLR